MPDGRHVSDTSDFYEPRYFNYSVTYRTWVKLFIADVFALQSIDGFEGTQARFWKNHPIRWLQVVGTVVALNIRASFTEVEIDDGSGKSINLYLRGTVAQSVNADFERNKCDIDICALVKAKGTLSVDHKGDLQIAVVKIEALRDAALEFVAWQERLTFRAEVLDIPWRIDTVSLDRQMSTKAKQCEERSSNLSSAVANKRAQLKEEDRSNADFVLEELEPQLHTIRNLKVFLLQYFTKNGLREFSIAQLRSVVEIERATVCVAQQTIRSRQSTAGMTVEATTSPDVTSTQKYRTLNACLVELVRDGSLLSTDTDKGEFCVVGKWNLGVLIRHLLTKSFGDSASLDEVSVREMWQEVRRSSQGYDSISKQMVQRIMEEMKS